MFRVYGFGCRLLGLEFGIRGAGLRVRGQGFMVIWGHARSGSGVRIRCVRSRA